MRKPKVITARMSRALHEGVRELAHHCRQSMNYTVCETLLRAILQNSHASEVYYTELCRETTPPAKT